MKKYLRKSCLEELKKLRQRASELKNRKREILKKFKKEINFIKAATENTFLKTYRTDLFHQVGYFIHPLLLAIAQNLRVNYRDLLNFTYKEIIKFLKREKLILKKC